jgi:hypothetical protein
MPYVTGETPEDTEKEAEQGVDLVQGTNAPAVDEKGRRTERERRLYPYERRA